MRDKRSGSTREIEELLKRYDESDGHAPLDTIAEQYPANASMLHSLLTVAESAEPNLQLACLALLKRHQQAGSSFSSRSTGRLLELLPTLPDWRARLQILQMLPELEITKKQADSLADSLHVMLRERNKFIRAWVYSGLHRIAFLHPAYRAEVTNLLQEAARQEAASIRARLRQLAPL